MLQLRPRRVGGNIYRTLQPANTDSIAMQRLIAPTPKSSPALVAAVKSKDTQLQNVPTSLQPSAITAKKRVKSHGLYDSYYLTLVLGHSASECKANRVFDISNVPEMDAEAAWNALKAADEQRELDDFRIVRNTYNTVILCVC